MAGEKAEVPTSGGKQPSLLDQVARKKALISQLLMNGAIVLLVTGVGMPVGFSAILLPQLQNADSSLPTDDDRASWIASVHSIMTPVGAVMAGSWVDRYGRRALLQAAVVPLVTGWLLMSFAASHPQLLAGRMTAGFAVGMVPATAQVLIGEISEPRLRGVFGSSPGIAYALGILVVYVLGSVLPWRVVAALGTVLPTTAFLLLVALPESPVWLVNRGRTDDARRALLWLRGGDHAKVNHELNSLLVHQKAEEDRQCEPSCQLVPAWLYCLARPEVAKPFAIILVFCLLQVNHELHSLLVHQKAEEDRQSEPSCQLVPARLSWLARPEVAKPFTIVLVFCLLQVNHELHSLLVHQKAEEDCQCEPLCQLVPARLSCLARPEVAKPFTIVLVFCLLQVNHELHSLLVHQKAEEDRQSEPSCQLVPPRLSCLARPEVAKPFTIILVFCLLQVNHELHSLLVHQKAEEDRQSEPSCQLVPSRLSCLARPEVAKPFTIILVFCLLQVNHELHSLLVHQKAEEDRQSEPSCQLVPSRLSCLARPEVAKPFTNIFVFCLLQVNHELHSLLVHQKAEEDRQSEPSCQLVPARLSCLARPEVAKPFAIILVFCLLQILSGSYVVIFYGVSIVSSAAGTSETDLHSLTVAVVTAAIRLLVSIVTTVSLLRLGRRKIGIISGLGSAGACLLLVGYLQLRRAALLPLHPDADLWVTSGLIVVYVALNTFGIFGLPSLMMGEVLPSSVRGFVSGLLVMLINLLIFSSVKLYPLAARGLGPSGVFLGFGVVAAVTTVYVYLFLPETKDRPLTQIEQYFATGKNYLWSSRDRTLMAKDNSMFT